MTPPANLVSEDPPLYSGHVYALFTQLAIFVAGGADTLNLKAVFAERESDVYQIA